MNGVRVSGPTDALPKYRLRCETNEIRGRGRGCDDRSDHRVSDRMTNDRTERANGAGHRGRNRVNDRYANGRVRGAAKANGDDRMSDRAVYPIHSSYVDQMCDLKWSDHGMNRDSDHFDHFDPFLTVLANGSDHDRYDPNGAKANVLMTHSDFDERYAQIRDRYLLAMLYEHPT